MKNKTFSPYQITWVQVKSTNGIITKKDICTIACWDVRASHKTAAYLHFPNKAAAVYFIERTAGKTEKRYECRLFTDKQFGMMENGIVPFTTKQQNEVYYI